MSINGISPKQTVNNYKSGEQALDRGVLRRSWNQMQATGTVNDKKRVITPFRAVNNLGDFLARKNYVCGGSNQVNASKPGWKGRIGSIMSSCDGSDSSDYITYKKQRASNVNYNDNSFGGDESNASFVSMMAVRR